MIFFLKISFIDLLIITVTTVSFIAKMFVIGHLWIKLSFYIVWETDSFYKPVISVRRENFFTDSLSMINVYRDISADCFCCIHVFVYKYYLFCFYTILDWMILNFFCCMMFRLNSLYQRHLALWPLLDLICYWTFKGDCKYFQILCER